jgi:hypothetical protein
MVLISCSVQLLRRFSPEALHYIRSKCVPNAADCLHEAGMIRVGFDLLAQARN